MLLQPFGPDLFQPFGVQKIFRATALPSAGWTGRVFHMPPPPRLTRTDLNDPASMPFNLPQPQQKGKVHAYHALASGEVVEPTVYSVFGSRRVELQAWI